MSDAPAVCWTRVPYAEASYWEARYCAQHQPFEWFLGYTALRRMLRAVLPKRKPVLQIGCGTSNIQEGMAGAGWKVVNIDIANNVIEHMKVQHQHVPALSYAVADCRDMGEYMDCQFGGALDKGTVDALLCCKDGVTNVTRMLSEVSRVLCPGGVFLLVSLGDPARRLCLLCCEKYDWTVQVLLLPKIKPEDQATVDDRPVNDTRSPVEFLGPYDVLNAETVVGLPSNTDLTQYFFGYLCKKRRLQLLSHPPTHPDQQQRLSAGWVQASRTMVAKLQQDMGLPEDILSRGARIRSIRRPRSMSSNTFGSGGFWSDANSATSSPLPLTTGAAAPPLPPTRTQSFPDLRHGAGEPAEAPGAPLAACSGAGLVVAAGVGDGSGGVEVLGAMQQQRQHQWQENGQVQKPDDQEHQPSRQHEGGPAAPEVQPTAAGPAGPAPAPAPAGPAGPRAPGRDSVGEESDAEGALQALWSMHIGSGSECAVPSEDSFDGLFEAVETAALNGAPRPPPQRPPGGPAAPRGAAPDRALRARRHSAPPQSAPPRGLPGVAAAVVAISEPCLPPEPPKVGIQRLAEYDELGELDVMPVADAQADEQQAVGRAGVAVSFFKQQQQPPLSPLPPPLSPPPPPLSPPPPLLLSPPLPQLQQQQQ